tara:strand:- start:238 stop:399 length:162 start_codon:yes stop_codon:yes gene_type:complete
MNRHVIQPGILIFRIQTTDKNLILFSISLWVSFLVFGAVEHPAHVSEAIEVPL